jgi:1-pyrroline-5-carboxylate dehydrogenase
MATLTHPAREANRAENRITVTPMSEFSNEPMIDWSNPENLRRMNQAIDKVRSELGREYDLVLGGRRIKTGDIAPSSRRDLPEVVGLHHRAGPAEVEPAMQAALRL